jgi:hypothetical protein
MEEKEGQEDKGKREIGVSPCFSIVYKLALLIAKQNRT